MESPVVSHLALRLHLVLLALLLLSAGSAFAQPPIVACEQPGIVFIADGSGGLPGPGYELCRLVSNYCPGMHAEIVDWTWGVGMVALDMWGHRNHQTQGRALAERVMTYLAACPNARIYLVGHSSGTAVVLAATECLPPGCVNGVILLAPSVSRTYNVCPALMAAAEGVDVFYSHRDFINLSFIVTGTSDLRYLTGAAGFHGFKGGPCCGDLHANLRQHPNAYAGHFHCTQTAFLCEHVLPILQRCAAIDPAGIHSAGYLSPEQREQALVDMLPPVEEIAVTAPQSTAPGPGGIAPISDTLRLP
jgi:hypothetical protein